MNYLYNAMVFNCQKKCLLDFKTKAISEDEKTCMTRCSNEHMFLDNFIYESDSAQQLASTEGKPKKASFFISRRIEDLTQDNTTSAASSE